MLKRFFGWLFGWNAERKRLHEMIEAARQDVDDAWKEVDLSRNCPCLSTTPCDERCTCVMPHSSRGCSRCAMYGSEGQRKYAAAKLAAKIDLKLPANTIVLLRGVARRLAHDTPHGQYNHTVADLERLADLIEKVHHAAPEGWTEEDFKRELGEVPEWVKPQPEPAEPVPQSNIQCVKRADLDSNQSEGIHLP